METPGESDQACGGVLHLMVDFCHTVLFGKLPLLFARDCKLFLDLDRKTKPVSDKTRCTLPLFWIQPDVGVQGISFFFENPSLSRMQDDKDQEIGGVGVMWETIAP